MYAFPTTGTTCGEPAPECVIATVPLKVPALLGSKSTVIAQEACTAKVPGQLLLCVNPLLVWNPVRVIAVALRFVSVILPDVVVPTTAKIFRGIGEAVKSDQILPRPERVTA